MNINPEKLKQLMEDNLYTVRSFAKEVWVTENYITNIRSWSKWPSKDLLRKIIEVLKIKKEDLL